MTRISSLALTALLLATGHAVAQTAPDMTLAEVRKIDVGASKITLKHGEIKNLDMPPMSMVFQVKNPTLLTQFKVGDTVQFTADKINGAYTVLTLVKSSQ